MSGRTGAKATSAATRYQKEWRLGYRRLVDAGPVLAHIERLRAAGWPMHEIALRAGLSRNSVHGMLTRRPAQARSGNARAILALRPGDLMAGRTSGRVSRIGTARRVQALLAMGWTYAEQSARCGFVVRELTRGDNATVTVAVHNAVAAMYEELCMKPGPSQITRRRALKAGYAPPLAWPEDIDDLAAVPDYGQAVGREAPLDEWLHLVRLGVPAEQAMRQCGTSRSALEKAAYRHDRRDVLTCLGITEAAA